jgi:hypothetical protein
MARARLDSERACWAILVAAMALSAAAILWFTRGTSFFSDEFTCFVASRGFDVKALLSPHNGHLFLGLRVVYAALFDLFGADYLVLRLLQAVGVALVAGLFYVLAKRRVEPAVALGPAILLLFLGSAPDSTLSPLGIPHVYSLAAGLGALIALERGDRRGDAAACVLLVVSVSFFSIGLAFIAAAAVSVGLRADRWRRAWIALVPVALYAAWLFLAPKYTGAPYYDDTHLSVANVLLIPSFVADAAAAVLTAVSGLGHDFAGAMISGGGSAADITQREWGYPLAAAATAGLVARLWFGPRPRPAFWVSLGGLLAFWASTAMVSGLNRYPYSQRYAYAGAILLLLVAASALTDLRLPRWLAPAVLGATVLALGANLYTDSQASGELRAFSTYNRADLTALELARNRVDPAFIPPSPNVSVAVAYQAVGGAGPVLDAVARNGSFAYSLPELRAQPEEVRGTADAALVQAERLQVAPAAPGTMPVHCRGIGDPGLIAVGPPGVLLRSPRERSVTLGRFATLPAANVGSLAPGELSVLRIPADAASDPWRVALSPGGPVTVCRVAE